MKAIRTGKIEIDLIKTDQPSWISAEIQKIEIDPSTKKVTAIQFGDKKLYRRVDKVAAEIVSVVDPVTGETFNISIAGVGQAITKFMVGWMLNDFSNTHYDPDLGFVIDGSN